MGRIKGGRCGGMGPGGLVGGKWRQLYLNNNKKDKRKAQLGDRGLESPLKVKILSPPLEK